MRTKQLSVTLLIAALPIGQALAGASAGNAHHDACAHLYQKPAQVSRTMTISPTTKYVNVVAGEAIRFIVDDKSFVWRFDRSVYTAPVDLREVAPEGLFDHPVTAYVAPNPMYFGAP